MEINNKNNNMKNNHYREYETIYIKGRAINIKVSANPWKPKYNCLDSMFAHKPDFVFGLLVSRDIEERKEEERFGTLPREYEKTCARRFSESHIALTRAND